MSEHRSEHNLICDVEVRVRCRQSIKIALICIPTPAGLPRWGGNTDKRNLDRLPASYANFYIANEVVLAPVFGHANDSRALATLQKLFRDRRVVGINCEPLVWGMGTIHCVTQQQPKP